MAWVKCKYCGNTIDEKAVICTNCGTNQKTGKSLSGHNAHKKKSKLKFLLFLLLLTALIGGGIYIFKRYRTEISTLKSKFTAGTKTAAKTETKAETKTEIKTAAKAVLKEEHRSFPLAEKESSSAKQYKIYSRPGVSVRSNNVTVNFNVKVVAPKAGNILLLKVYQGKSPEGEYVLVHEQTEKVKVQEYTYRGASRAREDFLKLPEKYANAPEHIKKRMLERRKQVFERMQGSKSKGHTESAVACALFDYVNQKLEKESGGIFFRTVLYDAKGNFIKEGKPTRVYVPLLRVPRSVTALKSGKPQAGSGLSMQYAYNSQPPSLNGHTIYPYFYGSIRTLKFASLDKNAFEIISFSIDGIKYPPIFTGVPDQQYTYTDRKTRKKKTYYSSSLNLAYPFGGQVEIKFRYKMAPGKFKDDRFSFYLPPPPPLIHLKTDKQGKVIKISWDKLRQGIDESHFFEVPSLSLERNHRDFKEIPVYKQNTVEDPEVFPGEPANYQLVFKDGIYKAPLWSSEKGLETYKLQFSQVKNPFGDNGQSITVPSGSEKAHPVRIELLKTSLCYENTGIAACKLMNKVLGGVAQEKDMVFYDRQSRDYIIDEKFFALSESLKKQFMIKEADYAIQIKDYSRQDGNGLELWLFKKKIEGTAASKSTVYWRIADINLKSDPSEMKKAVEKLVAKIRETLEFRTCPDQRKKTIKPKNIICMPLRPLNQCFVVWNYAAICESLFLSLSEKSGSLKILSRDDWDQLFNERIRRFDEGHSVIDNMVREVLLTGRLWRTGNARTYYIQACDAFSGEVLGARVFAGKLNTVAMRLAVWLETLRLSNDIKADLQISKFHQKVARTAHLRPWLPRNDLLKNFGPYISNPDKSWSVRKKKGAALRSYKGAANKGRDAFYSLVKRQWKDGFQAKAISMLEKDWKESKKVKTGELLSSYYVERKRYGDALKVYDSMLKMDDCPDSIYKNYNLVKSKARCASRETPAPAKTVKQKTVSRDSRWKKAGTLSASDSIDHSSVYTDAAGKRNGRSRTEMSRNDAVEKYYFVDRDKICAEWAPGQPCRTAKLAFSIPGKLLFQGINSKTVKDYGVWTQVFRLSVFESYSWEYLFADWKLLSNPPVKVIIDGEPIPAARQRQMESVCKTRIVVFEAGWNSIDPFSENLDDARAYIRLAYFFRNYTAQPSLTNHLYDRSLIRAFFELEKKPDISFPKFTFCSIPAKKAYVSQIRAGKDMIRFWALELIEVDRRNKGSKYPLQVRDLKLYQMLALNYMVRRESNPVWDRIYRMLKSTPIPTSVGKYRKAPTGTDFLVFMAYKKNKKAIKLLNLMLDSKAGYISDKYRPDYAYVLAQSGNMKLAARMAPTDSYLGGTAARWLPKEVLDAMDKQSLYLIFGTKSDRRARKWFLEYGKKEMINQYFGKPPAEAYRDWKLEHFKKLEQRGESSK